MKNNKTLKNMWSSSFFNGIYNIVTISLNGTICIRWRDHISCEMVSMLALSAEDLDHLSCEMVSMLALSAEDLRLDIGQLN